MVVGVRTRHWLGSSFQDGAKTLFPGGHQTWVFSLAFSKDGNTFVSGGGEGKLTWWETASAAPAPLRSIAAHKGWIRALAVSPMEPAGQRRE